MKSSFIVLFYEDGNPMDHRCIERFIKAFPKGYQIVVEKIIVRSEKLEKETFGRNLAELMPSFKMTRAGAFHGLRIAGNGELSDPNNIIGLCWDRIGDDLQKLKHSIKTSMSCTRSRVIVDLSSELRDHAIEVTSKLFRKLLGVYVGNSSVGPVGATKALFAAIPEIALPVDNLEWKQLFKTNRYDAILSTMASEIADWEKKMSPRHLDDLSLTPTTTLPSIYNVLAMASRDLTRTKW